MKKGISVFLLILLVMVIITPALAVETVPDKRVAIGRLNITGDYSWGIQEWLPRFLEAKLVKSGWTVLGRGEAYHAVREEQHLAGINPATQPPRNEIWGATAALKLTCRTQVNRIAGGGLLRFGETNINVGSYIRVQTDLIGEMLDTRTGQIKPVAISSSREGALESLGVYINSRNSFFRGGAIHTDRLRETLLGKAADEAVEKLVQQLNQLYDQVPGQGSWGRVTIPVPRGTQAGDLIGIFRAQPGVSGEICVGQAQVEQILVTGQAVCKVVDGSGESRGCSMQNLSRKIY